MQAARNVHLSGHGGTNDGIIGAAAAVGLTHWGWSGRFIDLGGLRDWPKQTTVSELIESGIESVSVDRDAKIPAPSDIVITNGWLRPLLIGHRPILLVMPIGPSIWKCLHRKRNREEHPRVQNDRPEAVN
jgi:hypothetical protein